MTGSFTTIFLNKSIEKHEHEYLKIGRQVLFYVSKRYEYFHLLIIYFEYKENRTENS